VSIAQKLAWELQVMNERSVSEQEQAALEICYGVALAQGYPGSFASTMETIAGQVTDKTLQHYLRVYTGRGLK